MLSCVPCHWSDLRLMLPTSRSLRLALYIVLIIAGAAIAATLAMRHTVRQSMVEDAARANQQLALYARHCIP